MSTSNTITKSRMARIAALLLTLTTVVCLATPASARDDDDPDPTDESGTGGNHPQPPPYVTPTEGFNWHAPNRFAQWDNAWHPQGWVRDWPVETYNP